MALAPVVCFWHVFLLTGSLALWLGWFFFFLQAIFNECLSGASQFDLMHLFQGKIFSSYLIVVIIELNVRAQTAGGVILRSSGEAAHSALIIWVSNLAGFLISECKCGVGGLLFCF